MICSWRRCDLLGIGEDGKKFKTRSGETVKLTDLLSEAVRIARDSIRSRRAEEGGEGYQVTVQPFVIRACFDLLTNVMRGCDAL